MYTEGQMPIKITVKYKGIHLYLINLGNHAWTNLSYKIKIYNLLKFNPCYLNKDFNYNI
jgi:hypothetical protein